MRSFIFILVGGLFSFSCQLQESPDDNIVWSHFFRLETNEGQDYFSKNVSYKFVDLNLCDFRNGSSCKLITSDTLYYTEKEGFNVFAVSGYIDRMLDFGNGDIDTISYKWEPNVVPRNNFSNLEYFDVLYNGKQVFRYDFKDNSPSRLDLLQRNSIYPYISDPIIIPVVKEHTKVEEGN